MPSDNIVTDQIGRSVTIQYPPRRIISLVPSQTELLFDLSLDERVIGITKFCVHPKHWLVSKTKVGGTKQLNIPLIKELNPDLVIANKEENDKLQIEELMEHCSVWVSDIDDLDSATQMISQLGDITVTNSKATSIIQSINNTFAALKPFKEPLKVLYLIWRKPYMVAGNDTFINDLLNRCGFVNAIHKTRYPQLHQQLDAINPDVILLSSEPYPFKQKHVQEISKLYPDACVCLVDGEMFSWYGSRLLHAGSYLQKLINQIEIQYLNKNMKK